MGVKLLTEHHFEFLCLKGGCTGHSLSLRLSKYHIVGNHVSGLICLKRFNSLLAAPSVSTGIFPEDDFQNS